MIFNRTKNQVSSTYSDFRKDMIENPLTGDLALRKDEDAIKESLRNLFLTDKGERLFQPEVGSDIRASLFENNTPATLQILKEQVKDVINNFEPRVGIIDVNVYSDRNEDLVKIDVTFYMQNREDPIEISLFLERTR